VVVRLFLLAHHAVFIASWLNDHTFFNVAACRYSILDKRTGHFLTGPGGSVSKYIGAKIFADQFIFEPFNLALYFMATKTMEGAPLVPAVTEFKKQFPHLFLLDSAIWPLAQYINFRVRTSIVTLSARFFCGFTFFPAYLGQYLPLPYQALYVNAVSLGWAVILSFMTHRSDDHAPPSDAPPAEREHGKRT
jgi:hypothetical protein